MCYNYFFDFLNLMNCSSIVPGDEVLPYISTEKKMARFHEVKASNELITERGKKCDRFIQKSLKKPNELSGTSLKSTQYARNPGPYPY